MGPGRERAQTRSSTCWGTGCWSIFMSRPALWSLCVTPGSAQAWQWPEGVQAAPRQLGSSSAPEPAHICWGAGLSKDRSLQQQGIKRCHVGRSWNWKAEILTSCVRSAPTGYVTLNATLILFKPFVLFLGKERFQRKGTKIQTVLLGLRSNARPLGIL